MLCAVTQFLALIRFGSNIRKVHFEIIGKYPSIYFSLVQSIESLLYHSTFFFMIWFKREIFMKAIGQMQRIYQRHVNEVHNSEGTPVYKMIIRVRWI